MIPAVLVLAAAVTVASAQSCPSGYAPHTGTIAQNQTIAWVACPVSDEPSLECGTLEVPLDWKDVELGIITLPLVRVPANESLSIGKSIIYNPGGPGASGIQSLIGSGSTLSILAGGGYHMVSFDPRGVGLTIPYECPTVDSEPGAGLPLNDPRGLNATFVTNVNQGNLCGEPEYRQIGEVLGTAYVARDINAIAEALGEDGLIRYWGFSYGTLLGATVSAMFPEKLDRVVLDGNINPTDYYHGLNEESVDNVDAALLHFFQTCAEAGPSFCALADGSTGEELNAVFFQFVDMLKSGDITVTVTLQGDEVDVAYTELSGTIYSSLKSPSEWPDVALAIATFYLGASATPSSKKRDFDPLAAADLEPPQTLSAVSCGDWDDIDGSLSDFKDWLALYQARSRFGGDQLISILYACATWQTNAREKFSGSFTNIETRRPILFVNNPFDPVTPLISAQNSSSGFVGSAVLEHRGAGHCSTAQRNTCVFQKVASYWETGVLPDTVQICQPDAAPFSGELIPAANITGPDLNSTDSDRSVGDDAFSAAVADVVGLLTKRNENFEYPTPLQGLKRDLHHVLQARQNSGSRTSTATLIPATCTPDSSTASSTGNAENGERSSNAGTILASSYCHWVVLATAILFSTNFWF